MEDGGWRLELIDWGVSKIRCPTIDESNLRMPIAIVLNSSPICGVIQNYIPLIVPWHRPLLPRLSRFSAASQRDCTGELRPRSMDLLMRCSVLLLAMLLCSCEEIHRAETSSLPCSELVISPAGNAEPAPGSSPISTPGSATEPKALRLRYSGESSHTYLGPGVSLYGQETRYLKRLQELRPRYVRLEAGPSWASLEERLPDDPVLLESHIRKHFNAQDPTRLKRFQESFAFFQEHDIRVILIIYQQPYHWLQNDYMKTLKPGAESKLVRLWVALLEFFHSEGMPIDFVELANEPEGNWNGHIPTQRYYEMVTEARKRFDRAGFSHVKIVGPGLSSLNLEGIPSRWIRAMPPAAEQSLAGFSLHAWDDVLTEVDDLDLMRQAWSPARQAFRRQNPRKPIFITEYAREVSRRRDVRYYSPAKRALFTASDTHEYAIQFIANTLIHLEQGAAVTLAWRLSDLNGDTSSWGLIRSPDRGGSNRPAFGAFRFLNQRLSVEAEVLKPREPVTDATIASVLLQKENAYTFAVANTGSASRLLDLELLAGDQEMRLDVLLENNQTCESLTLREGQLLLLPAFSVGVVQWSK